MEGLQCESGVGRLAWLSQNGRYLSTMQSNPHCTPFPPRKVCDRAAGHLKTAAGAWERQSREGCNGAVAWQV